MFNPSRRSDLTYAQKRKKILEIMSSFDEEEQLRWYLEPEEDLLGIKHIAPDYIGKTILKLTKKYGSVNKAAQKLGVSEDWLQYYLQHIKLSKKVK
jgi:hypothetical protein